MYNVNGNYNIEGNQNIGMIFGPADIFRLNNSISVSYRRSVDLLSENTPTPEKNKVGNTSINESVALDWKFGKNMLTAFGDANWSRFTSKQTNFNDFTAKDFSYGLRGSFSLPVGFGLSTDLTVYTRRGYADSSLNKTNFVWNARASYTVLKGQLSFMVDGFDILHNLSNVFYNVNAQARTETYTNELPRYVMLHIQWKFHKSPKKK